MLPVRFWELESIYPSLCHPVGLDTSTMWEPRLWWYWWWSIPFPCTFDAARVRTQVNACSASPVPMVYVMLCDVQIYSYAATPAHRINRWKQSEMGCVGCHPSLREWLVLSLRQLWGRINLNFWTTCHSLSFLFPKYCTVNQCFKFTCYNRPCSHPSPLGAPAKLCTRDRVHIQLQRTNLNGSEWSAVCWQRDCDLCPKAPDKDLSLAHLNSIEHQLLNWRATMDHPWVGHFMKLA